MKKLVNLVILAIIANLTTVLLFVYGENQSGRGGFSSFPITLCIVGLWFATMITALTHSKNKNLFKTEISVWAILVIQFCTPFPLLGVYRAINPAPTIQQPVKDEDMANSYNPDNKKLLIHNVSSRPKTYLYRIHNKIQKIRQ